VNPSSAGGCGAVKRLLSVNTDLLPAGLPGTTSGRKGAQPDDWKVRAGTRVRRAACRLRRRERTPAKPGRGGRRPDNGYAQPSLADYYDAINFDAHPLRDTHPLRDHQPRSASSIGLVAGGGSRSRLAALLRGIRSQTTVHKARLPKGPKVSLRAGKRGHVREGWLILHRRW
jgi:hypothetical protein